MTCTASREDRCASNSYAVQSGARAARMQLNVHARYGYAHWNPRTLSRAILSAVMRFGDCGGLCCARSCSAR
jgi:hypothetical protein